MQFARASTTTRIEVSLSTQDICRNRDRLFTLRTGNRNTKYRGAQFVNGVAEPVKYRTTRRLKAALGASVVVTFYEPPKPKPKKKAVKKMAVDRGGNPLFRAKPPEPSTGEPSPKEDVKDED